MLERVTNEDLQRWLTFFKLYGFRIEREDRRMLHICDQGKDGFKRAIEYAKRADPVASQEDQIWSALKTIAAQQSAAIIRRG